MCLDCFELVDSNFAVAKDAARERKSARLRRRRQQPEAIPEDDTSEEYGDDATHDAEFEVVSKTLLLEVGSLHIMLAELMFK